MSGGLKARKKLTVLRMSLEEDRRDLNRMWWCTPVSPTFGRLRQGNPHKFKASFEYTMRLCLIKPNQTKTNKKKRERLNFHVISQDCREQHASSLAPDAAHREEEGALPLVISYTTKLVPTKAGQQRSASKALLRFSSPQKWGLWKGHGWSEAWGEEVRRLQRLEVGGWTEHLG